MKKSIIFSLFLLFSLSLSLISAPLPIEKDFSSSPWKIKIKLPTLEEYLESMAYWSENYPTIFSFEKLGENAEKQPIILAKLTDRTVLDSDKYVILVTALHSGAERSGGIGCLNLIDWLLAGSEEAKETLRNHIIYVMPIVNPYAFFTKERIGNSSGIDPYSAGRGKEWNLKDLSLLRPELAPEILAFMNAVDLCRPEVHVDIHGVAMHYCGQLVTASLSSAGSNYALRPWDWRISEAMMKSANEEGFGYWRMEADAQRLFYIPQAESQAGLFWFGRPYFYTAHYAYMKYHTLLMTIETGYAEESVAAMKGLFRLGNSDKKSAYPVNVMKSNMNTMLCASGKDLQEIRKSRRELWQRESSLSIGILYPETDCRAMAVFIDDPKTLRESLAGARPLGNWVNIDTETFLRNISGFAYINTTELADFIKSGPQKTIFIEKGSSTTQGDIKFGGIGFVIKIPYKNPRINMLQLNGHEIPEGICKMYYKEAYTTIEINLTSEERAGKNIFIVSCAYTPQVPHKYGWQVPPAVKERLSKKIIPQ